MSSLEDLNIACDTDQIILDTIYISSDDDLDLPKKNTNNGEEHVESKTYSGPMRARLLPARRGRNIERRKAYTKRWVERKKALLASIGENVSDTDSIASDDVQLSPVQKARAKTNADKEIERQKKIARALKNLEKNLEINLTKKYATLCDKDTDSDTRRTRLSKEIHSSPSQQSKKNSLNQIGKKNIVQGNKSSLNSSMEIPENSSTLTDNITSLDSARKSDAQVDDQIFTPYSMKSELVVGDTTYAVTSTLILVDPLNNDNKQDLNNVMKDSKSFSPDEREKNTDIIDAVQLRRVNPPTNTNSKSNSKQLVERCLNIEVEGNELAVLKRVQYQLADFVEREMKNKLLGTSDVTDKKTDKTDKTNSATHLHQKLDQKLKDIIEIAIKKNIESSVWRKDDCQEFPSTSLKLAMNSFKYQPKVLIKRLDIAKESKRYNIKNAYILKQTSRNKLIGPFSVITRKRQSIPPVRYGDYNTSALDSDSDVSDDNDDDDDYDNAAIHETPKVSHSRKHGNPATRQSSIITVKSTENKQDEQKADYEEAIRIAENHICGVCGLTFHSRKDVEAHVRTHKVISSVSAAQIVVQNENATTSSKTMGKQGKQKMMRCKRCHEIVEARLVKAHVCKSTLHKCYVCDSMFRTKNLLAKHLESHDHSEFNIVNAIGNKKINNSDALLKIISTASTSPQKDQAQGTETATKTQATLSEKNDIQSDKITSTGGKLDSTENVKKPKETYTCFVCDKIFTDEEILKDHLQKHCDDLSEGEQSNSKEQYQCAICGNTLESDQALEEHVSKHLFDDEDDNPNLISIDQGNENNNKAKETETYQCGQCSEMFDSEILLEMHMHAHEEEVAISEWEKQGLKVYQYQCMLCDELFDTEEDLAKHLDIHNANAQVCQLCDKPFRTLEDLQEHVASH